MSTSSSQDFQNSTSPQNRAIQTFKDLTAGAAGGIVQVLIGQPFDLVKVRLQSQGGGSIIRTVRGIWTHEGPLAFYKGTLAPLIGIGACVSIQFGAFHEAKYLIETYNSRSRNDNSKVLSMPQVYLAGGIAGVANSVLAGPIEHVRIRLQLQPHGEQRLYSGPKDCLRTILRHGGIKALFRGNSMTLLREFHGFGVWFATYEGLMEYVASRNQQKRQDIASWKVALCGGIAGDALWLATYPVDIVKTKMQNDGLLRPMYKNAADVVQQTWKLNGLRGFFPGLIPTLIRTMFTSAGTFVTVEEVKKLLG